MQRIALLLLVVSAATACAPLTRYRRAALVQAPVGETLTTPMERPAQIGGTVSYTGTAQDLLPQEGDPALHRTEWNFAGHARFRIGRYIALGGHGTFSHYDLSFPSAFGTPPVNSNWVGGLGPNLLVQIPLGSGQVTLTGATSFTFLSVPWTSWERTDSNDDNQSGEFDANEYELIDEGRDLIVLFRMSWAAHWRLHEHIDLYGGMSFASLPINIGFDNEPREGSTVAGKDIGVIPYLGATFYAPGGVYAQMQYFLPLGYEQPRGLLGPSTFGGFMLTLGADLGSN